MSFDLFFCKKWGEGLDGARLREFFSAFPGFSIHGSDEKGFQAWYENEDTGVYFSFDYSQSPDKEEGPTALPPEFCYTGLSFNLNYIRPSFFALEAMPYVELVGKQFDALVVDAQEKENDSPDIARPGSAGQLAESWERHNSAATRMFHQDKEVDPREKSLYWWQYMRGKDALQNRLGENVFVPTIVLLRRPEESSLYSAVLWTNALPQVFPAVDFVVRQIMAKPRFGKRKSKNLQILSYEEVTPKIRKLLKPCEGSVPGLVVLAHEKSEEIKDTFSRMVGPSFEGYTSVAPDGFVDVPLPENKMGTME